MTLNPAQTYRISKLSNSVFRRGIQLFWIGVCALAMLWQTRLLLGDRGFPLWLAGFVFGATVFGYSFTASDPVRRWLAWGAGALAGICFLRLEPAQQFTTALPAAIWFSYYFLHGAGRSGLRRYPVLKPVAIALAWSWVTVLLPLPLRQWGLAAAVFAGRWAYIFSLALAYDLCDRAYDRRHGLVTLVMQLGPGRSFRLIDAALLCSGTCCCLNGLLHIYSWPLAVALLLSLALSRMGIRYVAPQLSWGAWRKAAIDGLMVLQLSLVWMAKM